LLPKPKTAFGRVILANGSRLSLAKAECADGRTLTATTLYNTRLSIPLEEVIALYLFQGRATYLSDLKPRRIEGKPFGNLDWPLVADASVSGLDLRLAGSCYDKGLGLHSESRVTYNLAGGYHWFEALVGLEEQSNGKTGSARVKILVDGKPKPVDGDEELTGKSKPLAVRLDVQGAKELTLVVEFGKRGDILGRVNWIDARLIK
ncbi:MAG TPA: NPCBM/NEW2 domain-containing protein, partial [Gemmataceae bacterium]